MHLIEASPCLLSNYTNYCSGCQKDIASHLNADKSVIHRAQPGAAESLGAALWAKDLSLLSFSEAMAAEGQISKQSLPIVLKGSFLGLQPRGMLWFYLFIDISQVPLPTPTRLPQIFLASLHKSEAKQLNFKAKSCIRWWKPRTSSKQCGMWLSSSSWRRGKKEMTNSEPASEPG